ncbi:hypothetical protein DXG01_004947 [Tephrocybe rancida]|nr:hypothetical protein DXG01_004947 [Tephrocybe rancida]
MSNYSSLAFNDFPGAAYASNRTTPNHWATENVAGGQFSQRYYQSSSLASALTPVIPKGTEGPLWPQKYSESPTQTHSPGYPNDSSRYAEHAQTIPRSASVMPERRMHAWNGLNAYGGHGGSPLSPEYGARRAATPGPTDLYQSPKRHTSSSKFREPLYERPGNPAHASVSASGSWTGLPSVSDQDPTPYYSEPSLEQLYTRASVAAPTTKPPYFAPSGFHATDRYTPVAGQPSSSPDALYVDADNQEDTIIIHCPHTWCKSTFTRSNDLTRHLATASIHKAPVPVDPSKICRMCGEEFSRSDARNRHEIKRSCGRKRTRASKAADGL